MSKIITHDDFDGLVSATICSHALSIAEIQFAGPRSVTEARITITEQDVVCDLPYPLECGLWFDHHEGNFEEMQYRDIDPATIEGRFELKDSCARIVFEYFNEKDPLPIHFAAMVEEADVIDSFNYCSVDDWRRKTPGKIIDSTLKLHTVSSHQRWEYLRHLISLLKNHPIDVVATRSEVIERYREFQEEEKAMLDQIGQNVTFLSEDVDQRLIILDLTHLKRQPRVIKNLAFIPYAKAEAVIEIKNMFQRGTKTNNLSFSMALSLNFNSIEHKKDVGDIMRRLNIGSGHKGAGAGTVQCTSKEEMLRKKREVLEDILTVFQSQ